MRQIKFRSWDGKNMWNDVMVYSGSEWNSLTDTPVPNVLMQFTSLTDKNGKEIYEGDILKVQDPYNENWSTNGAEVIFSNAYVGGWVISDSSGRNLNLGSRQSRLQIIGNVHENPELLLK